VTWARALRARRVEAEELVAAMNRLLDGVTTSQGRPGVAALAPPRRRAGRFPAGGSRCWCGPLGALLPDERQALRDCLQPADRDVPVRAARAVLRRAPGPRASTTGSGFAFRVPLHQARSSTAAGSTCTAGPPLSQGEQKVVCYLPLFAAAAAHFSSVAGACPARARASCCSTTRSRRSTWRTHPLLFGLLVDLDLDFLITSERLWGRPRDRAVAGDLRGTPRPVGNGGSRSMSTAGTGHQLHVVGGVMADARPGPRRRAIRPGLAGRSGALPGSGRPRRKPAGAQPPDARGPDRPGRPAARRAATPSVTCSPAPIVTDRVTVDLAELDQVLARRSPVSQPRRGGGGP